MRTTRISQVNVEAGRVACLPIHNLRTSARPVSLLFAWAFALLLLISAQLQLKAQSIVPEYIPLNAEQLDQLVAPIALDPDPLVAQILIGATFPDQVTDANNWTLSKASLTPDQRATQANSMAWDPSIKGLVVFPLVLDSMAKNNAWTVQLGNAYYNQPDDVMAAIQALRQQALQARVLVNVPQERIVVSGELIEIQPADPNAVYVAYYNPWAVWGSLFAAYPGYVEEPAPAGMVVADGVSFEPAVSAGLDAHFGFSFGGWDPGFDGGAVTYGNNVYNSNSRTVADRGQFGGHDCRAFDHGGRGVPVGYHPGHSGFDGRGPIARPEPRRVSGNQPANRRPGLGFHPTPVSHPYNSGRIQPGGHSTPVSHRMQSGRQSSTGRLNNTSHTAVRNTPSTHTSARSRNSIANHAAPANHLGNSTHAMSRPASASRPQMSGRPTNQGTLAANRQTARPSSPSNRPSPPSTPVAANRNPGRPAMGGNSFGANHPMNRPAANNNAASATHAMARPASMSRPAGGGGSFGHKH